MSRSSVCISNDPPCIGRLLQHGRSSDPQVFASQLRASLQNPCSQRSGQRSPSACQRLCSQICGTISEQSRVPSTHSFFGIQPPCSQFSELEQSSEVLH